MPVVAIGDRVLVSFVGRLFGQRFINTFWYKVRLTSGDPEYAEMAPALNAFLQTAGELKTKWLNCVTNSAEMTQIWVQTVAPQRLRKWSFESIANGAFDGAASTPNVQASITRVGQYAGRQYVGGIRIPIGTGAECSIEGIISNDLYDLMIILGAAMKEEINVLGGDVTLTPQVGAAGDLTDTKDMEDFLVQTTTRVIRRRTVGLGE